MHFTTLNDNGGGGTKVTKLAIVAALHVLLAVAFVKSIDGKKLPIPKIEDLVVNLIPDIKEPPPPPPEPPRPVEQIAPPDIVVPPVEVETAPPPVEPTVQATTVPDPAPVPAAPTQPAAPANSGNTGAMRTAVLADAAGCATPAYPANAVRNGDEGTVTLALLVGADGKVQSSRIQKTSGHRELDRAAVNALSLCTFKPAMNNGTPESGWAQIAYVWTLE